MNTATTTYLYLNPPPPTHNTLDSHQKTRLIRTTRKLGTVLGTTPHLAESDSPVSVSLNRTFAPKHDRKRRQGSIFQLDPSSGPFVYEYTSSSAQSSMSSLPRSSLDSSDVDMSPPSLPTTKSFAHHVRERSKSKGKRMPLPAPLVLRLNAVALPLSDPRLPTPDTAATPKAGSTAARPTIPATPTTPLTPSTPTATETRRKRLAKLKRTLGENVPAELVMPFYAPRAQHRYLSPIDAPSAPQTIVHPAHQQAHSRPLGLMGGARKRSVSVDYKHGVMSNALAPSPIPSQPYRHLRAPSQSADVGSAPRTPAPNAVPAPDAGSVWVAGTGWTGEWNRKDIREVQRKLRNLKLR